VLTVECEPEPEVIELMTGASYSLNYKLPKTNKQIRSAYIN